jgi:hypothetical protein
VALVALDCLVTATVLAWHVVAPTRHVVVVQGALAGLGSLATGLVSVQVAVQTASNVVLEVFVSRGQLAPTATAPCAARLQVSPAAVA